MVAGTLLYPYYIPLPFKLSVFRQGLAIVISIVCVISTCSCMCVYMYSCGCECMCVVSLWGVYLESLYLVFSNRVSHLNWSYHLVDWPASELESTVLHPHNMPQCWVYRCSPLPPNFFKVLCNPGWPWTHYLTRVRLKFEKILQPLPPKCWAPQLAHCCPTWSYWLYSSAFKRLLVLSIRELRLNFK